MQWKLNRRKFSVLDSKQACEWNSRKNLFQQTVSPFEISFNHETMKSGASCLFRWLEIFRTLMQIWQSLKVIIEMWIN